MSSLKDCEFWIEKECYYATTGGGGYQVHRAFTAQMKTPADLVCFVEKRRLDIATKRLAELEILCKEQSNALEEVTK
jgi:hypothetical protein